MNRLAVVVGLLALLGCGQAVKSHHDAASEPDAGDAPDMSVDIPADVAPDTAVDSTTDPGTDSATDTTSEMVDDPAGEPTGTMYHCTCYRVAWEDPVCTRDVCMESRFEAVEYVLAVCTEELGNHCAIDLWACEIGDPCYL